MTLRVLLGAYIMSIGGVVAELSYTPNTGAKSVRSETPVVCLPTPIEWFEFTSDYSKPGVSLDPVRPREFTVASHI
ncbi:hypothetical protein F5Y15DRAFT_66984 [Xylariaceae sp. FL0016]|nr:hypothetical protein F5Y15DRAFT_66984 [Xylariaceae sp. FL0016]